MSLAAPAELAHASPMASKSREQCQLFYHPLLSIRELEVQLPQGTSLSVTALRSISLRIRAFATGTAKRNKDFKDLAGFSNHGLFELRWDLNFGSEVRKVRLIGARLDTGSVLFLLWHSKDPSMTSEDQRTLMNLSCAKAIERKESIDTHSLAT
jgi:hypothetical protein